MDDRSWAGSEASSELSLGTVGTVRLIGVGGIVGKEWLEKPPRALLTLTVSC